MNPTISPPPGDRHPELDPSAPPKPWRTPWWSLQPTTPRALAPIPAGVPALTDLQLGVGETSREASWTGSSDLAHLPGRSVQISLRASDTSLYRPGAARGWDGAGGRPGAAGEGPARRPPQRLLQGGRSALAPGPGRTAGVDIPCTRVLTPGRGAPRPPLRPRVPIEQGAAGAVPDPRL